MELGKPIFSATCQICREIIKMDIAPGGEWLHKSNGQNKKDDHIAWPYEGTIVRGEILAPVPAANPFAFW